MVTLAERVAGGATFELSTKRSRYAICPLLSWRRADADFCRDTAPLTAQVWPAPKAIKTPVSAPKKRQGKGGLGEGRQKRRPGRREFTWISRKSPLHDFREESSAGTASVVQFRPFARRQRIQACGSVEEISIRLSVLHKTVEGKHASKQATALRFSACR
jgi:hypothetical protein